MSSTGTSSTRLESVARPKQARSRETLDRILRSAEELIGQKGLADVSVPDIATHARSSVGGFYARFRDKNELLRALEERFFLRLGDRLDALADPVRWADASVAEVVAACMHELVATVRVEHNLMAAFIARAAAEVDFRLDGLRFRQRVSERIAALLLHRGEKLSHPEPAVAVDIGVQLVFGLMLQRVIFTEMRAAGRVLGDAALEVELTRNFLSYVGASGALLPAPESIPSV